MKKIVIFLQDNHHIVVTKENLPDEFKTADNFVVFLEGNEDPRHFIEFKDVPEKVKDSDEVIRTTHIVNANKIIDVVIQ
jgi:hypothetical protein